MRTAIADCPNETPATPLETEVWIASRLLAESAAYHMPVSCDLGDDAESPRVVGGLRRLLEWNPVFRTGFRLVDGQLVRCTTPPAALDLEVRRVGEGEEHQTFRDWLIRRQFNMASGPLVRFGLETRTGDRTSLHIVSHHVVFDGLSKLILARQFELALQQGEGPQFWCAQRLGRPAPRFADVPPPYYGQHFSRPFGWMTLPERSALGTVAAGRQSHSVRLDCDRTWSYLRGLRTSWFEAFLTALVAVLHACGNRAQPALTVAVSTRQSGDDQIGLHVNLVPVAVSIESGMTLSDLSRRVHTVAGIARSCRWIAPRSLLKAVPIEQRGRRTPLMRVLLSYRHEGDGRERLARQWRLDQPAPAPVFDLALQVAAGRSGVAAHLDYDAAVLDRSGVKAIAAGIEEVLGQMTRGGRVPLTDLALM